MARRGRASRSPHPDAPDDRRNATHALGSAYRVLRALRVLYIADAAILGVLLLLALSTDWWWAKTILGALFLAAVVGSIYVIRYPVPSTITLALIHTPAALFCIGVTGGPLRKIIIMSITAVVWLAIPMAFKTRRTMEAYPDLWAARAMRGEHPAEGRVGRRMRQQTRDERKGRVLKVLLFGVLPLIVLVTGNHLIRWNEAREDVERRTPTEHVETAALRFEAAWNGSQHDAVKAFIAESERDRTGHLLDKVWYRRKWREVLPPLQSRELIEHSPTRWYVHWAIEGYGMIKTSWVWEDGAWVVVRIRLKRDKEAAVTDGS